MVGNDHDKRSFEQMEGDSKVGAIDDFITVKHGNAAKNNKILSSIDDSKHTLTLRIEFITNAEYKHGSDRNMPENGLVPAINMILSALTNVHESINLRSFDLTEKMNSFIEFSTKAVFEKYVKTIEHTFRSNDTFKVSTLLFNIELDKSLWYGDLTKNENLVKAVANNKAYLTLHKLAIGSVISVGAIYLIAPENINVLEFGKEYNKNLKTIIRNNPGNEKFKQVEVHEDKDIVELVRKNFWSQITSEGIEETIDISIIEIRCLKSNATPVGNLLIESNKINDQNKFGLFGHRSLERDNSGKFASLLRHHKSIQGKSFRIIIRDFNDTMMHSIIESDTRSFFQILSNETLIQSVFSMAPSKKDYWIVVVEREHREAAFQRIADLVDTFTKTEVYINQKGQGKTSLNHMMKFNTGGEVLDNYVGNSNLTRVKFGRRMKKTSTPSSTKTASLIFEGDMKNIVQKSATSTQKSWASVASSRQTDISPQSSLSLEQSMSLLHQQIEEHIKDTNERLLKSEQLMKNAIENIVNDETLNKAVHKLVGTAVESNIEQLVSNQNNLQRSLITQLEITSKRICLGSGFSRDLEQVLTHGITNSTTNNKNRQTNLIQTRIDRYLKSSITNNPCDHLLIWGDDIPVNKKNNFRILGLNVNGLSKGDKFSKLHQIGLNADLLQIDFLGLIETNINWKFENVKEICHSIIRKYFKSTKIIEASTDCHISTCKQPGGILSSISHPWASRSKVSIDSSTLGRWTETEISGKQNRKITIITAYQVCKQNINTAGATTSYMQQWGIIKSRNPGKNVDPRAQFTSDLKTRIESLKKENHEVILVMDANDTLQHSSSELTKFTTELNLIDIMVERHGNENEPATYARGSTRIDYIFITEKLSEYISSCGILPLHEICSSDHRALFVDIDIKAFLGGELADCFTKHTRGVHSNDKRTVMKFQKLVKDAILDKNIPSRCSRLEEELSNQDYDYEKVTSEMEDLDNTLSKIKLESEEACRNKHYLPWSPTLRNAYNTKQFWALWHVELRNPHKNFYHLRLKYVNKDTEEFLSRNSVNMSMCRKKLKESVKELKNVQLKSSELREKFLSEQAEMARDGGDSDLQKIIENIRKSEERKRIFSNLKRLKGNTMSYGLDHIISIDNDGNPHVIQEADLVFEELLKHNTKHFSQADGTPFTTEPLKTLLGPYGTSTFAQQLLRGNQDFDHLKLHEATNAILHQLQLQLNCETISDKITTEDLISGYKKWGEFTSTSPSGNHLSMEKCILRFKKTQDAQAEHSESIPFYETYFKIKAVLLNASIRTGYVFKRWQTVVNALIEKIPGTPLLTKLRVIHLIESDFNLMIGILWGRRLIWSGENNHAFHDGQGGSRPFRRTQELLLTKHMQYAIWRLSQTNGSSFDNDAKSCFDRIVMPLVSLGSQQLGMPPRACELFLKTLSSIKYHVKTNHGISQNYYTTSEQHTIHGPGQGGRGSPSAWVVISSLIMYCMKQKSTGSTISNPYDPLDKTTLWITGFVDDVTHWCSSTLNQSPELLVKELQNVSQWWEQLLHATGGKLKLNKCFFYIVHWDFDLEGIPSFRKAENFTQQVKLIDSISNKEVTIPQRDCNISHKTLGVMECPNGDNRDEMKRIHSKSNKLVQKLATSNISKAEANVFYFTTYLPSVTYGFSIGTFFKNELESIQSKAIIQFTNAMGYCQTIPRSVLFGSRDIGGIGLRHLFAEQGTEKCISLIRYIRSSRPVGSILRKYINWVQLVSGISSSILENVNAYLPHLDNEKWIQSLREFLAKSACTIKIANFPSDLRQCKNDKYIMDIAISKKFSPKQIQQINRCRMFLKAVTISDICDPLGKQISSKSFNLEPSGIVNSNLIWPNQPRPGPGHIFTWKNFLKSMCKDKSITLVQSMDKWFNDVNIRHHISQPAFINDKLDPPRALIHCIHDLWYSARLTNHRTYWVFDNEHITTNVDTSSFIPAVAIKSDQSNQITWRNRVQDSPMDIDEDTVETRWEAYQPNITTCDQIFVQQVDLKIPIDDILSFLLNPLTKLTCVSDGSVSEGKGSFGWIISHEQNIIASGSGHVPGRPMSSERAEASGKLSWLLWIFHLSRAHNIQIQCIIDSYTDSKAVVSKSNRQCDYKNPSFTLTKNYDLFSKISSIQEQFHHITIPDTKWVKGHQDKEHPIETLSLPAQLNIQADRIAKQMLDKPTPRMFKKVNLSFDNISLAVNNEKQSSGEHKLLRWRASEFELQKYYKERFKIKGKDLFNINWAGMALARNRLSISEQNFSIKHVIGWLPVGSKLTQRKELVTECPLCKYDDETIDHLWKCPSRTGNNGQLVTEFFKFLSDLNTDPYIACVLSHNLSKWLGQSSSPVTPSNIICNELKQAIKSQTKIGWNLMVRGILVNDWATRQEHWFLQNHIGKLGDTWSADVSYWFIKKSYCIWNIRNEHAHNPTLTNETRLERETLLKVQELYQKSTLLPANDQEPFSLPLAERLTQPWRSLQQWIQLIQPAIYTCIKNYTAKLLSRNYLITSFFSGRSNNMISNLSRHSNTYQIQSNHLTSEGPNRNGHRPTSLPNIATLNQQCNTLQYNQQQPHDTSIGEAATIQNNQQLIISQPTSKNTLSVNTQNSQSPLCRDGDKAGL